MAKAKKKTKENKPNKEASTIFHSIMKASVSTTNKKNTKSDKPK